MPKLSVYKQGAVVYFKGDHTQFICVLKSGNITIKTDEDNPQGAVQVVQPGSFFGVKATLAEVAQDETALCLTACEVLLFSVAEFEDLALKNSEFVLKMLKVFSHELASGHRRIEKLILHDREVDDDETTLYNVGVLFLTRRYYKQSVDAFKRYLVAYPQGRFIADAQKRIDMAEPKIGGREDASEKLLFHGITDVQETVVHNEYKQLMDEALVAIRQNKFPVALLKLNRLLNSNTPDAQPYIEQALYYYADASMRLGKPTEAIEYFTKLIQEYPQSQLRNQAMLSLVRCYESSGDNIKAKAIGEKMLSLLPSSSPLFPQVQTLLKRLK